MIIFVPTVGTIFKKQQKRKEKKRSIQSAKKTIVAI